MNGSLAAACDGRSRSCCCGIRHRYEIRHCHCRCQAAVVIMHRRRARPELRGDDNHSATAPKTVSKYFSSKVVLFCDFLEFFGGLEN
jgi:hypothetical protein